MKWIVIAALVLFVSLGQCMPATALHLLFREDDKGELTFNEDSKDEDAIDELFFRGHSDVEASGDKLFFKKKMFNMMLPTMLMDKVKPDVNDPKCKLLQQSFCLGEWGEITKKMCPVLCSFLEYITVRDDEADRNSMMRMMLDQALGTVTPATQVTNHGSCVHLSPSDCVGAHAETIIENCPVMCADNEICTDIEAASCSEEFFRGLCPFKCASGPMGMFDEYPAITPSPTGEVTNFPSCVNLLLRDCWGPNEKVVKLNCPLLCAPGPMGMFDESAAITPAPTEAVTDYPSCVHLLLHDCWGPHEKVVKINCPVLCSPVMGNTLEANRTQASYLPPKWAWVNREEEPSVSLDEATAITPAPITEVTDFPVCMNLMLHDCWGKNEKVVKLNCPKMCAPVMGNTLEANRTKANYKAPSWAWASFGDEPQGLISSKKEGTGPTTLAEINLPPCEEMSLMLLRFSCSQEYAEFVQAACPIHCAPYVKSPITVIAVDKGADSIAEAVFDEAVNKVITQTEDDVKCFDIGAASCSEKKIRDLCPFKCASVLTIDCEAFGSCDEEIVQMLCPKRCEDEKQFKGPRGHVH